MTVTMQLVVAAALGCLGVGLVVTGAAQRRPSLAKMSAYLAREPIERDASDGGWRQLGRPLLSRMRFNSSVRADLRMVRRTPDTHAAMLVVAAAAGLFGPSVLLVVGQVLGVLSLGVVVPLIVAVLAAVLAPLTVHLTMRSEAAAIRQDLRYQLSAYLDVVTMLLAGNVGNEGSLRQAAAAGDGRLFVELRRQILVAETSNRSIISALGQLGNDFDLVELQQVAASASLGAGAGAPVAKSLAAKCATLRSALASEQEADARVRTTKITGPLVAMSLLIMATVIYPALNFSR
jgi:Flp pilus assembly protein TadB